MSYYAIINESYLVQNRFRNNNLFFVFKFFSLASNTKEISAVAIDKKWTIPLK